MKKTRVKNLMLVSVQSLCAKLFQLLSIKSVAFASEGVGGDFAGYYLSYYPAKFNIPQKQIRYEKSRESIKYQSSM